MSCRHRTVVLRIPASALGFETLRTWNEFLKKHEADFEWEEGCFCEALCDSIPWELDRSILVPSDPDCRLGRRDPMRPDIVPGPFLDYYLLDDYPFDAGDDGGLWRICCLNEAQMKQYLPVYQKLFPHFTMKDMQAVRLCDYEWYDGSDAPYLYSEYD